MWELRIASFSKAGEALPKWVGVEHSSAEGRRMHENSFFPHTPWVVWKTTSWSGPNFLHTPLQASPTRCPLTSCLPVRGRLHPPLLKMNTTRMGIWTSLGLAQVSPSWWSREGLDVGEK